MAIALEVAWRACEGSGRAASELASVFASSLGDTVLSDYLCEQLAGAPLDVSPTKFHNSVHNAAAGYWAIATSCPQPYTALTAHRHTFGTGFVTACAQASADGAPVLYVAYDVETRGPLATVVSSRGMLAAGLVLAPHPSPRAVARLTWRIEEAEARPTPARAPNAALVEGNAMAPCLPLFEALADVVETPGEAAGEAASAAASDVVLTLGPALILRVDVAPLD